MAVKQLVNRHSENVSVHAGHPVQLPMGRMTFDQPIDLRLIADDSLHQSSPELLHLGNGGILQPKKLQGLFGIGLGNIDLIKDLKSRLAGLPTIPHKVIPSSSRFPPTAPFLTQP